MGFLAGCGLADLVLLLLSDPIGTTERIRALLTSGWFLTVGLFLFRQARRSHRSWLLRGAFGGDAPS